MIYLEITIITIKEHRKYIKIKKNVKHAPKKKKTEKKYVKINQIQFLIYIICIINGFYIRL